MPLPKPKNNENLDEFMNRCMIDNIMIEEYPNNKQRFAICKNILDNRSNKEVIINMEYKSIKIPFELKEYSDEKGIFKGYASIFGNVDDNNDRILQGAFTKSLKEDIHRIKILALHKQDELPIGKPITLQEQPKGLYIEGKISDTTLGKDVKILMKDKVLSELSIGYLPVDTYHDDKGVRNIKEAHLFEISPVIWGMNSKTEITEYKSKNIKGGDEDLPNSKQLKIGTKAFDFSKVLEINQLFDMLYNAKSALNQTLNSIEYDDNMSNDEKLSKISNTLLEFSTVIADTYQKIFEFQMNQKSIEQNSIELKTLLSRFKNVDFKSITNSCMIDIKSNCKNILKYFEESQSDESNNTKDEFNNEAENEEEYKELIETLKQLRCS